MLSFPNGDVGPVAVASAGWSASGASASGPFRLASDHLNAAHVDRVYRVKQPLHMGNGWVTRKNNLSTCAAKNPQLSHLNQASNSLGTLGVCVLPRFTTPGSVFLSIVSF